jgi:dTDP-4-amino-4,6-dideoxygalactose transaminase
MTVPVVAVPQADPGAGYRALQGEIDAAVARALQSGWYILGQEVAAFEREFAGWLGSGRSVGCGNGTDAIALALRALGIGPGMAVATVSHTAVATVAAIEMAGAVPVLIDIEPDFYTMDPRDLRALLERPPMGLPPIRAVIPVHLYGQPADLFPIMAACAGASIFVVEDCAQAHGAMLGGKRVGTLGKISAFSLYPTKNLGALGDGGMVATDDAVLADEVAALRQYGWKSRYVSDEVGVNSRLDELQAAILRVKLQHLDRQNARRGAIAAAYDAALAGTTVRPPARRAESTHVFHLYVIRVKQRAAVQEALRARGIGTAVHYPVPVHRQPAYLGRVALGTAGCRASEVAAEEVLSLPIFPEMTDQQVERVCSALGEVFGG